MDIETIISELREEQELVDAAIIALERLAVGSGKRRGRPPKWLVAMSAANTAEDAETEPQQKKRTFSPEARKRMAEAQRKRFAAARAEAEGA